MVDYLKNCRTAHVANVEPYVIHDLGHELVVGVRLLPGLAQGWHVFTIILANGHSCKVGYLVK